MNPICHLHSLSAHVPPAVLTNETLTRLVDTNDEWIVSRTGIKQRRRLADAENASDLGLSAARKALAEADVNARSLTHIIAATCTPDLLSPSVACILAGKLDARPVMAFDFGAACSGFLYGLSICRAMLCQDPEARILFVCTEALTRRTNWRDRSTCVLFGDGAAACVADRLGGSGSGGSGRRHLPERRQSARADHGGRRHGMPLQPRRQGGRGLFHPHAGPRYLQACCAGRWCASARKFWRATLFPWRMSIFLCPIRPTCELSRPWAAV